MKRLHFERLRRVFLFAALHCAIAPRGLGDETACQRAWLARNWDVGAEVLSRHQQGHRGALVEAGPEVPIGLQPRVGEQ